MSTIWNQITFKYQTINRKIFISTFQCEIENLKNCFGNYVTCNMNNTTIWMLIHIESVKQITKCYIEQLLLIQQSWGLWEKNL